MNAYGKVSYDQREKMPESVATTLRHGINTI
jgi:hypothetical protein